MPSSRFVAAFLAPETSECPVVLVTITHASFAGPMRFNDSGADLISNGNLFEGRAQQVALPGEGAEAASRAGRIVIDDTDQLLVAPLRNAGNKPFVRLDVVLAAYPDDIEVSWPGLRVTSMRAVGGQIELDLARRDDSGEIWPYQGFTPHRTPGLFT